MRYTQPKITGTLPALSTIKSSKVAPFTEGVSHIPTNGNAYQADE